MSSEGFGYTGLSRHRGLRVGIDVSALSIPMRGLGRYTLSLIDALSLRDDIQPVLITPIPPLEDYDIGHEVLECRPRSYRWWITVGLPRLLVEQDVDVFHAPADRGLPLVPACPLVVTVHDIYERLFWRSEFRTARALAWYWLNEALHYSLASAVVAVSQATARDIARLRIARRSQIRCVPNVQSQAFGPTRLPGDVEMVKHLGLSEPFILFVGGYDPRKNVETLVRAFALLPDHQYDLVLVGAKQFRYHDLMGEWKSLPCFERLRPIEISSNLLPALYRTATVCVVPSHCESFSYPAAEAMASGIPLICSDIPAVRETAGDAALYFDPNCETQLTSLLTSVLHDSLLRSSLRANGLNRSHRRSVQRQAEAFADIYWDAQYRRGFNGKKPPRIS